MKITKRQLRRIIQEEKQKLDENPLRKSPGQRVKDMSDLIEKLGPEKFARALMMAMGDQQDELDQTINFIRMRFLG